MAPGSAPHVLVVDPSPDLLTLYRLLLEGAGYRVSLAASLPAVPAEVRHLAPDLLLLELVFNHRPAGLDFLGRLKADPALAALPVLVATVAPEVAAGERARLDAWSCRVLAKPFDVGELLAAVGTCLDAAAAA